MEEKEGTQGTQGAAAPAGGEQAVAAEHGKARFGQVWGFARKHPVTVLAVGAGAGLMVGVEFATGAAIGMAAALLFARRRAQETRQRLRERAGKMLHGGAALPGRLWQQGKRKLGRSQPGAQPSKADEARALPEGG
jgi:hypothetical protein